MSVELCDARARLYLLAVYVASASGYVLYFTMSVFARNCYCCNPILPFTCCVVDFFFASFNVYVLFRFIFLLFGETTSSFVTHESTKKRETVHSKGSCVYIHNIFVLCSTNLLPLKTQYFMYIDVMMINVLWPFSNVLCIGLYFIFFFFNIHTLGKRAHSNVRCCYVVCLSLSSSSTLKPILVFLTTQRSSVLYLCRPMYGLLLLRLVSVFDLFVSFFLCFCNENIPHSHVHNFPSKYSVHC